jgi:hypothetical protein
MFGSRSFAASLYLAICLKINKISKVQILLQLTECPNIKDGKFNLHDHCLKS